jgi:hypothetical protein
MIAGAKYYGGLARELNKTNGLHSPKNITNRVWQSMDTKQSGYVLETVIILRDKR